MAVAARRIAVSGGVKATAYKLISGGGAVLISVAASLMENITWVRCFHADRGHSVEMARSGSFAREHVVQSNVFSSSTSTKILVKT